MRTDWPKSEAQSKELHSKGQRKAGNAFRDAGWRNSKLLEPTFPEDKHFVLLLQTSLSSISSPSRIKLQLPQFCLSGEEGNRMVLLLWFTDGALFIASKERTLQLIACFWQQSLYVLHICYREPVLETSQALKLNMLDLFNIASRATCIRHRENRARGEKPAHLKGLKMTQKALLDLKVFLESSLMLWDLPRVRGKLPCVNTDTEWVHPTDGCSHLTERICTFAPSAANGDCC